MFKGILAASVVATTIVVGVARAECDTATHIEECKGKLETGYSVLQTYPLDGQGGKVTKVEDDNVLTKVMSYQVAICGPSASEIKFVLQSGKEEPILDNQAGDRLQPLITIKPEKSSLYYLIFDGTAATDLCGGAVLGMKKN
jgi:hypothetical protein